MRFIAILAFVLIGTTVVAFDVPRSSAVSKAENEVRVTQSGAILVTKNGQIPSLDGKVAVTWGPNGVVWASKNAREVRRDLKTGKAQLVPIEISADARAKLAVAEFTCTVISNDPYRSGTNVKGRGEQICSGKYGTQSVRMRFGINLNIGIGWSYWGEWFYTPYTSYFYATGTAAQFCPTPSTFRYRMSTTGYAKGGSASSPNILSAGEPALTCQ